MNLKDTIRTIPDFPVKGIMFRDITTLMTNRHAYHASIVQLCQPYEDLKIDNVAGIEARGFTFAGAMADRLGAGFVPIRKAGKLPGDVYSQSYDLEYGSDILEIHADAIRGQEKVVLVDDLIATGGTAVAAVKLLRKTGAKIVGAAFVVNLPELGGLKKIAAMGIPVTALVSFDGH
ncbi:adenine phosphoribosyltransferase [Robiginitomaculum antarcticum]|uniref:adenine phosphoribosyltransferase n=1 Tax=Robiginitomaculum antarcticum TaxID=437507 RepID=UPI000373880B|nr:adenine phosphoribosyltransferase [Robiginitomaculum antarcticum]